MENIELIKNQYNNIGCKELATLLKVNTKTIWYWADKFDLPGKPKKDTAVYIERVCQTCSKIFKKSKGTINEKHPAKYCSKYCTTTGRKLSNSKTNTCLELANKGFNNKEISKITGFKMGSIASCLNRAKFRRNIVGISFNSIRNKFLKNKVCEICGFNRIVEACHIIPASKQGPNTPENLLALCPNHHHLFDHNRLTEEEFNKIKDKVDASKIKSTA